MSVALSGGGSGGRVAAPIVLAILAASLPIIVAPGQTKVVRLFGRYVGTVRAPVCGASCRRRTGGR